jgi:DNA-binding MarR family transcriptional regulator
MKKLLDSRLSEFNITSSQASVLNTLNSQNGLSLSDVGKRVHLDKPAMTGLADRMEKDDLVKRKRISSDRRVIQLVLTKKGRDLYNKIETTILDVDQFLVSDFSSDEIKTLHKMLQRIWSQANNSTFIKVQ